MSTERGSLVDYDRRVSDAGRLRLAGVDEAGRGCWAGPVVAAAVVLDPARQPADLNDSKLLTPRSRERLFTELLIGGAAAWTACAVSPVEIDRLNILRATLRAMSRAVARLCPVPDLILIDGNRLPDDLPAPARAVVRGDATSAAIAAASIVAKVLRDRVMTAWDRRYPGYGFASHKGYGSPFHRMALTELGPCPLHRRTYRPVAGLDQGLLY